MTREQIDRSQSLRFPRDPAFAKAALDIMRLNEELFDNAPRFQLDDSELIDTARWPIEPE